mmetsp:Transcript_39143/g.92092  ORF Transcript_39143/g.92092 Transcript_39143/m.92092 type:complete len:583 (+) Transcript_39143:113-1861(+)
MGNSFTGFLNEVASSQEASGGGGPPAKVGCANDAVRVWGNIDTTKVDVGKFAARIRAAQEPIPAKSASIVHTIPRAHDHYVRVLTWDPFRDLLISGGGDGFIRMWSINDYSAVGELDAQLSVRALLVLTQELASGHSNGQVVIWAMEKPGWPQVQVIKAHSEAVYAIAMVRNGDLVTGAEDIRVFSRNGMMGGMLGFQLQYSFPNEVLCMCTVPNARYEVVTGDMNSVVTVWDLAKGIEPYKACTGHDRSVWAICYLREAKRVVSGSADHTIRIWDTNSWITERVLKDHLGWVVGLSAGPRWLLSCSNDHTVRVWDCESWFCERTFDDQSYEVYCVSCFSGGRFATGGAEMAIIVYGGPEHASTKKGRGGGSSRGGSAAGADSRNQDFGSSSRDRDRPPQAAPPAQDGSWLPSWLGGSLQPTGATPSTSSAARSGREEPESRRGGSDYGYGSSGGYGRGSADYDREASPPRGDVSSKDRRKQLLASTNLDITMSDYHKHLLEADNQDDGRGRTQGGGQAPRSYAAGVDLDMTSDHFSHVDQLVGTNFTGKNSQKKGSVSPRVTFSSSPPEEKGVTEWKLDRR